jgi:hypothetical protein
MEAPTAVLAHNRDRANRDNDEGPPQPFEGRRKGRAIKELIETRVRAAAAGNGGDNHVGFREGRLPDDEGRRQKHVENRSDLLLC